MEKVEFRGMKYNKIIVNNDFRDITGLKTGRDIENIINNDYDAEIDEYGTFKSDGNEFYVVDVNTNPLREIVEEKIESVKREAKHLLDDCGVEWDDNFIDALNYTPVFPMEKEDYIAEFIVYMGEIRGYEEVLKLL